MHANNLCCREFIGRIEALSQKPFGGSDASRIHDWCSEDFKANGAAIEIVSVHYKVSVSCLFVSEVGCFTFCFRWQLIMRIKRGEMPLSPHVYLHNWQLKAELTTKAKAYDPCPVALFVST